MKVLVKENSEERVLKEGTFDEVKGYLNSELDNLLDWLDETENNWDDFAEMKNNIKGEMKMDILKDYNLYLNDGAEQFKIESLEEFERHVNLELKEFKGKEDLNLKPATAEELEETIRTINGNNKNGIIFFLISKEDDAESEF